MPQPRFQPAILLASLVAPVAPFTLVALVGLATTETARADIGFAAAASACRAIVPGQELLALRQRTRNGIWVYEGDFSDNPATTFTTATINRDTGVQIDLATAPMPPDERTATQLALQRLNYAGTDFAAAVAAASDETGRTDTERVDLLYEGGILAFRVGYFDDPALVEIDSITGAPIPAVIPGLGIEPTVSVAEMAGAIAHAEFIAGANWRAIEATALQRFDGTTVRVLLANQLSGYLAQPEIVQGYFIPSPVFAPWEAAHVLHEKVAAQGLWATYELECALIPAVAQMEQAGIYLHQDSIDETIEHYRSEAEASRQCYLETLDGRLQDAGMPALPKEPDGSFNTRTKSSGSVRLGTKVLAGFNLNSAQQNLVHWKNLGIEPVDEAKKPTTDKKVLARFQSDELIRMFLHYKRVEKRLGMAQKLVEHLDYDGRIRSRFMPLATGTGRFASNSVNLQQIPRDPEFRCAFQAPAGRLLVQADYSAMELRVAAAIAQEQAMIDAFNSGADIHTRSASLMFGVEEVEVTKTQRQQAKALNFGALYGSGAKGVQQYFAALGMFISEKQARELLGQWHQAYPAFGRWHRECQKRAEAGEPVRTIIGRRRRLFGDDNRLTTQANNLVQGTSADIMKSALIEIHKKLPPQAFLIATVHDEVLVECQHAYAKGVLEMVLREMEQAAVPILGTVIRITAEGGVLQNWGDK